MKHSGVKPSVQPRSLRTIAESNSGANFTGMPAPTDPIAVDVALSAHPTEAEARRSLTAADPQPFASLRG